jgi:photosystem II stability/assembly factor-like uncharacterized protein
MAKGALLVGTVGQGVMMTEDDGDSWSRVGVSQGLHSDCTCRPLLRHPQEPNVVYAGTDLGLYRSDDGGHRWTLLENPLKESMVWSLAIDRSDPSLMLAGTGTPSTPAIYRSEDGGKSWEHRPMQIAATCPAVGIPRPTGIAIDPTDRRNVWVGFEVDGVRRSTDGGDTWTNVDEIINRDVHNVTIAGRQKTVFTLVNDDVWRSADDGETWTPARARETFPWHYVRGIGVRPDDPDTLFVTVGDATPGRTGAIMRSKDAGETWQSLPLPVQPNSAMWTVGFSTEQPDTMFAATRYGYLYRSDDGGDSWRKLWRELGEVTSLLWLDRE